MPEVYVYQTKDRFGTEYRTYSLDVPRGASYNSIYQITDQQLRSLIGKSKEDVENILDNIELNKRLKDVIPSRRY